MLSLGSADISQPVRAGFVMFFSFVIGAPSPALGAEFAAVARGSAVVGWLVGTLFERAFGVVVP